MSSTSSSSSLFTPLEFTGVSQYSSDFQSIITRAVSIAQLPVQALSNHKDDIDQEKTLLSGLSTAVSNLGTSLKTIGDLGTSHAVAATTTDSTVVEATATGASSPGAFSITNVTSVASSASETSLTHYLDGTTTPVSATGTMKLVIGSTEQPITLGSGKNNLIGVRDAINALGVGVSASIITAQSGDYLSLSASSPGATTLQLIDDPGGAANNILTSTNQGSNTIFNLNGITINEPSTTINDVIPGVTLKFTGRSAANETIGINLATDRTQISSALQSLVSTYNSVADQVNAQIGSSAGLLTGNNIIYQVRGAMSAIVQYQGSGSMGNLANLGIEMGQDGHMTLNQNTFNALTDGQISQAFSLFGSSTSGLGALQASFTAVSDPVTGTAKVQQDQWDATETRLTDQISTMTANIASMQASLNKRLQSADAMLANLTSQQSILTSSIQSLNFTSYGKPANS